MVQENTKWQEFNLSQLHTQRVSILYKYNVYIFERKNTAWAMHVTAALSSTMHKMNPHMLNGNVAKFYRKA